MYRRIVVATVSAVGSVNLLSDRTVSNPWKKTAMDEKNYKKVLNDPIHGLMEFDDVCAAIIDTPQFQRLRYLKQLGAGYFVYPGASHNRFEHSLGVSHLAGKFVEELRAQDLDSKYNITDRDVVCVKVAGLCHDLGHGPWSHLFDKEFIKTVRPSKKAWKHEEASEAMLHYMWDNNPSVQKKITKKEKEFIAELIKGTPKSNDDKVIGYRYNSESPKHFLYEIVANNVTNFDVDKWDYFLRDCHYLGMASSFDYNRIIKFSGIVDGHIAIRDKEAFNMYEMFHTRYVLHRRAYQHKTVQAVEIMLVQALKEAEKFIRIVALENGKPKSYKISECIDHMPAYLNLTDSLYHQIKNHQPADDAEKPHVEKAKRILEDIEKRRLYRMVCESNSLDPKCSGFKKDEGEIEKDIKKELLKNCPEKYTELKFDDEGRIVVKIASLDYGSDDKDPLRKLKFFKKGENYKPLPTLPGKVSSMLKMMVFKEKLVRVFLRPDDDDKDPERCHELERVFRNWQEDNE